MRENINTSEFAFKKGFNNIKSKKRTKQLSVDYYYVDQAPMHHYSVKHSLLLHVSGLKKHSSPPNHRLGAPGDLSSKLVANIPLPAHHKS
jgi:hypothetical protein